MLDALEFFNQVELSH